MSRCPRRCFPSQKGRIRVRTCLLAAISRLSSAFRPGAVHAGAKRWRGRRKFSRGLHVGRRRDELSDFPFPAAPPASFFAAVYFRSQRPPTASPTAFVQVFTLGALCLLFRSPPTWPPPPGSRPRCVRATRRDYLLRRSDPRANPRVTGTTEPTWPPVPLPQPLDPVRGPLAGGHRGPLSDRHLHPSALPPLGPRNPPYGLRQGPRRAGSCPLPLLSCRRRLPALPGSPWWSRTG